MTKLKRTKRDSGRCGICISQLESLHTLKCWHQHKAKCRDWLPACPACGVRWVSGSNPSEPHELCAREQGSVGCWQWAQSQSRRELCCKASFPLHPSTRRWWKEWGDWHTEGISWMVWKWLFPLPACESPRMAMAQLLLTEEVMLSLPQLRGDWAFAKD